METKPKTSNGVYQTVYGKKYFSRPRPLPRGYYQADHLTWPERIAFVGLLAGSVVIAAAVVGAGAWGGYHLMQWVFR